MPSLCDYHNLYWTSLRRKSVESWTCIPSHIHDLWALILQIAHESFIMIKWKGLRRAEVSVIYLGMLMKPLMNAERIHETSIVEMRDGGGALYQRLSHTQKNPQNIITHRHHCPAQRAIEWERFSGVETELMLRCYRCLSSCYCVSAAGESLTHTVVHDQNILFVMLTTGELLADSLTQPLVPPTLSRGCRGPFSRCYEHLSPVGCRSERERTFSLCRTSVTQVSLVYWGK